MGNPDAIFIERINREARQIVGGGKMSEREQLTVEAADLIRSGLIGDARIRIERRDQPKWHSELACRRVYDAAMAAKRGVSA